VSESEWDDSLSLSTKKDKFFFFFFKIMAGKDLLLFKGQNYFRQRLLLAIFSSKPVRISEIRTDDDDYTGLTDYEASFLRLLEKITTGSTIQINHTGTICPT
jgi:RNA 3'-terminal phosphate cyclase